MKKDENAAAKKKPKTSAAQIRVQKGEQIQPSGLSAEVDQEGGVADTLRGLVWPGWDGIDLTELDLPSTMTTHFPVETDLLNFELTITPDDGEPRHSRACLIRAQLGSSPR